MFVLHSSNKIENLIEHLAMVVKSSPLNSPFSKEIFLIQSQGMERWISQQLARKLQVWGNFEFLFPNRFFNTLAYQIDPGLSSDSFDREIMIWRLERLLRNLDDNECLPLRRYINGENTAIKRFQLAGRWPPACDRPSPWVELLADACKSSHQHRTIRA